MLLLFVNETSGSIRQYLSRLDRQKYLEGCVSAMIGRLSAVKRRGREECGMMHRAGRGLSAFTFCIFEP